MSFLDNIKIGTKILGSFGISILFIVIVGFTGNSSLNTVSENYDLVTQLNQVNSTLLLRQIDHLNWEKKYLQALRMKILLNSKSRKMISSVI